MYYEDLKISAEKIVMSDKTKEELIKNCENIAEVKNMSKKKIFFKNTAVTAVVTACLCCTAAGVVYHHGFFKDIVRFDGAVVGTKYEQATNEIKVSVTAESENLTVIAEAADPSAFPYAAIEDLKLNDYKIVDKNGKTVIDNLPLEWSVFSGGKAEMTIPLQDIDNGGHTLIINSFTGKSKGDQPLVISGKWKISFNV